MEGLCRRDDVILQLHAVRHALAAGRLEDALELFDRSLHLTAATQVDLRDDHEYGHLESERQTQVLLRRAHCTTIEQNKVTEDKTSDSGVSNRNSVHLILSHYITAM